MLFLPRTNPRVFSNPGTGATVGIAVASAALGAVMYHIYLRNQTPIGARAAADVMTTMNNSMQTLASQQQAALQRMNAGMR